MAADISTTAPAPTPKDQQDQVAKAHYREFFDSRVFNFGDYNVLLAHGVGPCEGEVLVIGYRSAPREILICPYVEMNGLHPDSIIQVSDMDVSHAAVEARSRTVGIITTRGESLEFRVDPTTTARVDGFDLELDQTPDVDDFLEFMRIFEDDVA